MFILKKLLAAAILPPTGPLLLALMGLCLIRKYPRLGRTLILIPIITLFVLSTPYVASSLQRSIEIYPAMKVADLDKVQAIVVLGGGAYYNAPEYGGDVAGRASLERIRYAAWLYGKYHLPILVTGGAPFGGTAEALLMQKSLKEEFLVPVRWVEDQSRDTVENAEYSARILKQAGITRIALISHASHLPRAVPLFAHQGLTVLPAPTLLTQNGLTDISDWLPDADALARSRQALNERLGTLLYRLQGK